MLRADVAQSCSVTCRSSGHRQDEDVPLPAGVEGRRRGHVLLRAPKGNPYHGHDPE